MYDLYETLDWEMPNYTPILEQRVRRYANLKEQIAANPGIIEALKRYYANNLVEFINDWGTTYDPRRVALGERPTTPFILFPRQVEFIEWILARWKARERGLAEKSRDVGFTWLSASVMASLFLFYEEFAGGFGSRKEDLVDRAGDPKSIFWKVRKFIELLPPEFKPPEFHTREGFKRHSQHMLMTNPENGATISGEAGDEIGRGGRTSLYIVDESAYLQRPLLAEASLSANTDCRIDVSTVNGPGNPFYENRHKFEEHKIFVFDWTEDPRKRLRPEVPETDEVWYRNKEADLDRTVFAQEVLRDYQAAIANTYIETGLILAAEQFPKSKMVQPLDTPIVISLDAARGGNDEAVLNFRQGRINLPQKIIRGNLDGPKLAGMTIDEATKLLAIAPVAAIIVELDGPGSSVYDVLKHNRTFGKVVIGVHTGARMRDGRNYNLRAWLHRQAKEWLEDGDCHIHRDQVFRTQATSFLFTYKGGKLLIESKDEYKARFARGKTRADKLAGPSPDRWDAFMLGFMPPKARPVEREVNEIWLPLDAVMGY